ncbi:9899_t:CDS:2, partial [Rhizophagus irregularis]
TRVNQKIESELKVTDGLTLTLDGWTSKHSESLYNYIVVTPE